MTKDLIERLIAAGLTKQQASSVTAETLVNLFMNDDGKTLIREAQQQVSEMHALIKKLRVEYDDLVKKINTVSAVILSVSEAQSEYGLVTDEKAKNISYSDLRTPIQPFLEQLSLDIHMTFVPYKILGMFGQCFLSWYNFVFEHLKSSRRCSIIRKRSYGVGRRNGLGKKPASQYLPKQE